MYKSIITWVLYLYILCFGALMFNEIMFTQNGFKHKMKVMQINYDSSSDIISWCSSSCDVYTDDNVLKYQNLWSFFDKRLVTIYKSVHTYNYLIKSTSLNCWI